MLLEKILQSQGFGSRKYCQQLIKNGSVLIDHQMCDNSQTEYQYRSVAVSGVW